MAISNIFVWSFVLLLAAGSMNRWPSVTSAAATESLEDISTETDSEERPEDHLPENVSSEESTGDDTSTEDQTRNARSVVGLMSFHSELKDRSPFVGNLALSQRKMSLRKKRRSGVVIRGPFYPYPRPGHPLRFTSGASGSLPSSCFTISVAFGLAANFVAFWRT